MTPHPTYFCLLEEHGDERCKLQLELPTDGKNPPSVGAIRAALKQELNCRSSDLILYRQSNTSKSWTTVGEADCQRLVDDGSSYDDSIVFVKRRDRQLSVPTASQDSESRTSFKRRSSPPCHESPSKARRGSTDQLNPPFKRRSPVRHDAASPFKEDDTLSMDKSGRGVPAGLRKVRRVENDPGRPGNGGRVSGGWYDNNKYSGGGSDGYRRPLLRRTVSPPHFDRRARWSPQGDGGFWNASNSRKLEVNQMSLFKLRPGRWAPVVHNLISKQHFLNDLYNVISKNYEKRGREKMPFRIDSLGDVCITHDVKVPTTYSWKNIRCSREYKSLSSSARSLLESRNANDQSGEGDGNETIDEFETTICFIEIGQERLLVFDWYVYALEFVAEYREKLKTDEEPSIFYIYGQPRIGKSICILFLAIAAAFVGEDVYYYCDSKIWEVGPRGVTRWNIPDLLNQPPKTHTSGLRSFMFAELRIREQEDVLNDLRRVAQHLHLLIVASSVPEPQMIESRRWKASQPIKDENTPPFIFVPPPAWHELYALKLLSYPNISPEEFEFRFYLFGPIPRNIISENGPFGYVIDAWSKSAQQAGKSVYPHENPAPDLVEGEPPRLASLLLPVDPKDGQPTASTSAYVTLSFVSVGAETVMLQTRQS